jgi:hypothetical protein
MQIKLYPPLDNIAYFGSMIPLKDKDTLQRVLVANGQPFGVDWSGPACRVNSAWSCDKTYYQQLGLGAHNGIDLPCIAGTPVKASHNGVVTEISNDVAAGLGVVLWDKIQNIKTVYWHNKENLVLLNQEIKRGDVIALANSTGLSLGNHVHFMLKLTDGNGNTINKDNGYGGAIDPMPYFVFNNMTQEEKIIKSLQALEGYQDPEGIKYWAGVFASQGINGVVQYLTVRLADKIKQIESIE